MALAMEPEGGKLVCVGVITGAHGTGGHVRIKSFMAEPDDVARYGPVYDAGGGSPLRLSVTGRSRDMILARIAGIGDRNAAEALRGRGLFVPRSAFPPPAADEFYYADLVGLRAELIPNPDADPADVQHRRETLGTVAAVHDFGCGDIIEVQTGPGTTIMVPFTREAVPEVNLAEGWLLIARLPGLVDDAATDRASEESVPVAQEL
jgi:16S rRNA processing protein RimM